MWFSPALAVGAGALVAGVPAPGRPCWPRAPFLLAWLVSPLVAFWVSQPPRVARGAADRRGTTAAAPAGPQDLGFFETFVGDGGPLAAAGQLPGRARKAGRPPHLADQHGAATCSPRLAAHDFGYLSFPALVDRLEKTFDTFDRLERSHGHFYNWYDTQTLQAAAAGLHLDGGQRQPARLPADAQAGPAARRRREPIPSPAIRDRAWPTPWTWSRKRCRTLEPPAEAVRRLQRGWTPAFEDVREPAGARRRPTCSPGTTGCDRLDEAAGRWPVRVEKFAPRSAEVPEELRRWSGSAAPPRSASAEQSWPAWRRGWSCCDAAGAVRPAPTDGQPAANAARCARR